MHVEERSELLEDSIKAFHAGRLAEDIIQAEDDSNAKKEVGLFQPVCSSLQVADTGDIATLASAAASICTLAIMGASATIMDAVAKHIADARSHEGTIAVEDDFSDEYPLAIEVKPEKKEYRKEPLYQDLYKIFRECAEPNWDGYGAAPINERTFLEAIKLLDLLSSELQLPDVTQEPTGEIAFEWYRDKNHVFVISVGGNNTISYAGLFGRFSKTYGDEYFSDRIPESVLSNILRLLR